MLADALRRAVGELGEAEPRDAADAPIRCRRILLRAIATYVEDVRRQPGGPDREDMRLLAELGAIVGDAIDQHHVHEAVRQLTAPVSAAKR
jgi:hypothetical protein